MGGSAQREFRLRQARARILACLEESGEWMSAAQVAAGTGSTWDTTLSVAGLLRRLSEAGQVERRVLLPGTATRSNTHEYRALHQAGPLKEDT